MRRIIVKLFALYYYIPKVGTFLRASSIIAPSLLLFGICRAIGWTALSWPFLFIFVFGVWVGFDWFGLGYFSLWPIKWEELDDFQKYSYSFHEKLTQKQFDELQEILLKHPEWN